MHGWHSQKRLRPRRKWKAAGSTHVGGNEARELQIVAARRRFLSQNISAAAVKSEANFSPPKWGRGVLAGAAAGSGDGFARGKFDCKGEYFESFSEPPGA